VLVVGKVAAILALIFGAFLACAELARNWGNWQWWPFWLVDFIAASLLIAGGSLFLGGRARGVQLLAGAWGFTTAMFYMSFWSHIENFQQPAEGNLSQGPLTLTIGVMWVITIIGFVLALAARRRPAT
jgi:hypothetical protein